MCVLIFEASGTMVKIIDATKILLRTLWSPVPAELDLDATATSIEECMDIVRATRGPELLPDVIALVFVFSELCTITSEADRRQNMPLIQAFLDDFASVMKNGDPVELEFVYQFALVDAYQTLHTLGLQNESLEENMKRLHPAPGAFDIVY